MNSRNKGKAGELELAKFLRDHGIGARRGQQFSGGTDSPDVVTDLTNVHFECKRVEAGNVHNWMEQAKRDAGGWRLPIVAHRKNRTEWLATLRLEDLLTLLVTAHHIPKEEDDGRSFD